MFNGCDLVSSIASHILRCSILNSSSDPEKVKTSRYNVFHQIHTLDLMKASFVFKAADGKSGTYFVYYNVVYWLFGPNIN